MIENQAAAQGLVLLLVALAISFYYIDKWVEIWFSARGDAQRRRQANGRQEWQ